jgi:glutathione synthase/RimK-type ligase-like ATP-grasp enzyme
VPPVLLATCAQLPGGDEDSELLTDALRRRGIEARWQAWDDPTVRWDALTVIRSTWDYAPRREEFLRWAASVPALENPYPLVVWNSDKIYLAELAQRGIPTVPTAFVPPGEQVRYPDATEWVVKPSIGAGSRGAGRFRDRTAAAEHARVLHEAGRTAMLQPYLADVDTVGETALIFLDGRFSHAVVKGAMLPPDAVHAVEHEDLFVAERIDARAPAPAELRIGEQVLEAVAARFGATPLYARIDLLPGPDGPVLVEVEVTEPSLFLAHDAHAPERFADAIAGRLAS